MALFKCKRSLLERFPKERVLGLTALLASAYFSAKRSGLDGNLMLTSRFFAGYLIGYPSYIDEIDKLFSDGIRRMLFHSMFEHDGDKMLDTAYTYLTINDIQAQHGIQAGAWDGSTYFRCLDENIDVAGELDALENALRLGVVDVLKQNSS